MRILAGFYTHNKLRASLLQQTLSHFQRAATVDFVTPIVSSWEAIPGLKCRNVVSNFKLPGHGHLNIILQLYQIIFSCDEHWDFFAFCEHDCLYPENYFTELRRLLASGNYSGLASENHIGLRPNGYAKCIPGIHPLFAMVISRERLLESMDAKFRECVTRGWCCIEPDDRSNWLIQRADDSLIPIVHVNMDTTTKNHHLTNHYEAYSLTPFSANLPYWGDYRNLGLFDNHEIEGLTRPAIDLSRTPITGAIYGDFQTGRTIPCLDEVRSIVERGAFRVSNSEIGNDPAPGVRKVLRLTIMQEGSPRHLEFREGEIVRF